MLPYASDVPSRATADISVEALYDQPLLYLHVQDGKTPLLVDVNSPNALCRQWNLNRFLEAWKIPGVACARVSKGTVYVLCKKALQTL
jgi:hypothetical protein